MATKRLKTDSNSPTDREIIQTIFMSLFLDNSMSVDEKILSSDINNSIQTTLVPNTYPYHTSLCGSLLYSIPSKSPSDIFTYLRHANFNAFRRSLNVYHNEIVQMRNEREQTVLHILVIHAYQYIWVRLVMMRGCDTRAQDSDGYTAAHYAIERDDVEMLKALTMRFQTQARPISEEQITTIHKQCLNALSLKEKQGLTAFMLACHHESIKCLNYLISLNINDSHLEDKCGDTCLHYAVARRNKTLVEILLTKCQADVNGGNQTRPSALDVLQYHREQQPPNERVVDDEIEQLLLSHNAKTRCVIRRVVNKRKGSDDNEENFISTLACLSVDVPTNRQIEIAQNHAEIDEILRTQDDLNGALEHYKHVLLNTPNDTLDWALYAGHIARIHMRREEQHLALDFLEKALDIRKQLERNSQEIDQIQQTIDSIKQQIH